MYLKLYKRLQTSIMYLQLKFILKNNIDIKVVRRFLFFNVNFLLKALRGSTTKKMINRGRFQSLSSFVRYIYTLS